MSDFIQVSRKKGRPRRNKNTVLAKDELIQHYIKMISSYKVERCSDAIGRSSPFCNQGKLCFYAHGESELRRNPLRPGGGLSYSRAMCPRRDLCADGRECRFAHNDSETMYHPNIYKTKSCSHGEQCERRLYCAFRHDEDILSMDLRRSLFFSREDEFESDGMVF